MKKIVFVLLGFSSLMMLSCRQQEEIMDSEDLKSLSVLQEAKNKVNSNLKEINLINSKKDTIVVSEKLNNANSLDGLDKLQPPK